MVGGGFALLWSILHAWYAALRRRVRESARSAAAALGARGADSNDPRVDLYAGSSMGCRLYVAAHASVAPGPVFAFQRHPAIAILAQFPQPLPGLALTTVHMAPFTRRTGDAAFDQCFKLQAAPEGLAESAEVRRMLLALYGGRPEGSGIVIDLDEAGVLVRYSEPRPSRAADVARAALHAAVNLPQRAAFSR